MKKDNSTSTDPTSPLPIQLIEIPAPLSQRGKGSTVAAAMERLAQVPADIMNGIPEEVRTATAASGVESFDIFNVWRPAMEYIDAWYVCSVVAQGFSTVQAVRDADRLADEDFGALQEANERFLAAGGNFTELINPEVNLDVRRALENVNRGIRGEEPITREMVLAQRVMPPVAPPKKAPRKTVAKESPRKSAARQTFGEDQARHLILALVEAWQEFEFKRTETTRRNLLEALRPFSGSAGYSVIQSELDRKSK